MKPTSFTVQNWKTKLVRLPSEDSHMHTQDGKIIAVADGVTRDCLNGANPDRTIKGIWSTFWHYPRRPRPAKMVADIFCQTAYGKGNLSYHDGRPIEGLFRRANPRIREFNQENFPNPDYLVNDLAGCTAACATEVFGKVYWSHICDSGVAIFDKNGNLRFKTEDEGPHGEKRKKDLDKIVRENGGWENPKARRLIRERYRNNPSEELAFGLLTGELEAMHYVKTGADELRPGEHLIVYTDGLEPIITKSEFADLLMGRNKEYLKKFCRKNVEHEGSLAINYMESERDIAEKIYTNIIMPERMRRLEEGF